MRVPSVAIILGRYAGTGRNAGATESQRAGGTPAPSIETGGQALRKSSLAVDRMLNRRRFCLLREARDSRRLDQTNSPLRASLLELHST